MTQPTTYEAKVFAALVKVVSEQQAQTLMALNFGLFAKRFGYAQPAKCAKEMALFGDYLKPTELERWHM